MLKKILRCYSCTKKKIWESLTLSSSQPPPPKKKKKLSISDEKKPSKTEANKKSKDYHRSLLLLLGVAKPSLLWLRIHQYCQANFANTTKLSQYIAESLSRSLYLNSIFEWVVAPKRFSRDDANKFPFERDFECLPSSKFRTIRASLFPAKYTVNCLFCSFFHRVQIPGSFYELNVHFGVFVGGMGDFSDIFLGSQVFFFEKKKRLRTNNFPWTILNVLG